MESRSKVWTRHGSINNDVPRIVISLDVSNAVLVWSVHSPTNWSRRSYWGD